MSGGKWMNWSKASEEQLLTIMAHEKTTAYFIQLAKQELEERKKDKATVEYDEQGRLIENPFFMSDKEKNGAKKTSCIFVAGMK